jgi:hypothetical protein
MQAHTLVKTFHFNLDCGMLQHGAPGEKGRGEASVRAAFRLAAQYIALAQALQPGKDVYRKSLQARTQLCVQVESHVAAGILGPQDAV